MIAGLLHGLVYYIIIPPWWHYDEPGHFEYAWLAANRPGWPKDGEFDEAMRREMAKSMLKYGWYSFRNYTPNFSSSQPIWIGATQTGDKPAYYFLISLPLRLIQNADITIQYEVARFVSFLLYLLIILAVWKAMGEVVPAGHPLQWIVTAFVVLLPAFVDEMVSVNNDVGAVLASCLFLWAGLRFIKRGISIAGLVYLGLAAALCYFTKSTAWYALALAPLVLILGILHGRLSWLPWAITAISLAVGAFLTLEGGNPASWYQGPSQTPPLRFQTNQSPLGKYAFQIDYSGERSPEQTGQFLSPQLVKSLRGKTVTLGLWAWSDGTLSTVGPTVRFVTSASQFVNQTYGPLELNETPAFFRTVMEVPSDADYAMLIPPYPVQMPTQTRVYFDAVVLAQGQFSNVPPQFTDSQGAQGSWDGVTFHNLIRNGSAEMGNLRVRPWVTGITNKLPFVGNVAFTFSTLEDWQGIGWYYRGVALGLLLNFWSLLAGGHLGLPGNYSDNFLVLLTLLGLAGAWLSLWRKRKTLPWDIIYILGLAFVLVWVAAGIRGVENLLAPQNLYPWARYAYPAILPTALLLCAGWLEWFELLGSKLKLPQDSIHRLPVAIMLGLAIYTALNIIDYFHPSIANLGFLILLVGLQYLAYKGITWGTKKLGRLS